MISEESKFCWRSSISFCWRYLISWDWRLDSSIHSRVLSKTSRKESLSSVNQATSSCWRQKTASIWWSWFSCWTACFFDTSNYTSFLTTARRTPINFVSFFLDLVLIVVNLVEVQDRSSRRALHAACSANKVLFYAFLTRMPASFWDNDVSIYGILTRVSAINGAS